MAKRLTFLILNFTLLFFSCLAQFEGDSCFDKNKRGTCTILNKCAAAIKTLQRGDRPHHCGFKGSTPIVCCVNQNTNLQKERKSLAKCKSYHLTTTTRSTFRRKPDPNDKDFVLAVAGGIESKPREFPHMALLGYGKKPDVQWLCGGSLISENFILTAAHCVITRSGVLNYVRLGELDIDKSGDDAKPADFTISERIAHPNYNSSLQYNDIALLKLDRLVEFNKYIKPACLYTDKNIPLDQKLIVIGWGKTDFLSESGNSHLLKADLDFVDHAVCSKYFANAISKKLPQGILDDSQICAGSADGKDTCPGDSGGPLQIQKENYYLILGVTSFGKACGLQNSVGVYTRVSKYISWIENIVWPK